MRYFYVEPEVAGELGDGTLLDAGFHPPRISHLHYRIEGWLGDVLLESYPAFVVTAGAKEALLAAHISGADYGDVQISVEQQFSDMYPNKLLPKFYWLKPVGEAGHDDVAAAPDGRLVVSRRALDVLQSLGIANALVTPFEG